MIIYNVTTSVDHAIDEKWLEWMRNSHIPEVMQTNMFTGYKFLKLLTDQEDSTGKTYAVQYFCDNLEKYQKYQRLYAPKLQADVKSKFGEQCLSFRTLLEVI
ncbi:MAG: DUF4286 family protein [Bacteroidetes bacterium]|nr:MAG: DUF4286 family protein [Bacteroidota bacterium]